MVVALAIIGVACIAYGASVMMLWSGTWFFAVWYALGAVLLGAAWALHSGLWAALPMIARRVMEVVGCILLVGLLVTCGMAVSGFGAKGERGLDYLVVLGAQVRGDRPSTILQYRLDAAYDYLVDNPETKCIVSGGKGSNEDRPEAEVMASYLVERGIETERIAIEDESTNTVGNIENSMRFFDASTDRVGVVTNDFHVYRGTGIARKCGVAHVCGIAAPSNAWYLPNNLLRESISIAKDYAVGNL